MAMFTNIFRGSHNVRAIVDRHWCYNITLTSLPSFPVQIRHGSAFSPFCSGVWNIMHNYSESKCDKWRKEKTKCERGLRWENRETESPWLDFEGTPVGRHASWDLSLHLAGHLESLICECPPRVEATSQIRVLFSEGGPEMSPSP